MSDPVDWTEHRVTRLLEARYSHDKYHREWVTFVQAPDGTGWAKGRTLDFLAVNVWPSKMSMIGFEIKVSRQDWLHELDKPEKYEAWSQHVNEFYFVMPKGIAKKSEVPEGYGLMEIQGKGRLVRTVRAKRRTPKGQDKSMWMGLIRNQQERCDIAVGDFKHFSEWCGKPVSLSMLRALAEKYSHQQFCKWRTLTEPSWRSNSLGVRARLSAKEWMERESRALSAICDALGVKNHYFYRSKEENDKALAEAVRVAETARNLTEILDLPERLRTMAELLEGNKVL